MKQKTQSLHLQDTLHLADPKCSAVVAIKTKKYTAERSTKMNKITE